MEFHCQSWYAIDENNDFPSGNLLRVAETRFASNAFMARRLKTVKDALEKLVMDPEWKMFKVSGNTLV